jgi:hypothetical protein
MRRPIVVLVLALAVGCRQPTRQAPVPLMERREAAMELRAEFDALADEWERHRQKIWYSSNIRDYLDHPAVRKLVGLGRPAIPLIIERYKKDQLPWGFVLQEITGVKIIEDPNRFNPDEVKRRWVEWWEETRRADLKPAGNG